MPELSILIPLYNESESLPELVAWVDRVLHKMNVTSELVLVDDGSRDASWNVIKELSTRYAYIRAIRFRRNHGKSAALNVGFDAVLGDVVITMDADMQDNPDEIPALYHMIKEDGYELVSGWKRKRHDPISKTIPSRFFNWTTRRVSGIRNLHDFNCGLKAYRKDVVKSIEVYGEMHRYIPVLAKWAGYTRIAEKEVEHRARKYGVTKFGLERFINGFLDLLSITFVSKFGKRPMHFFGTMGVLFFLGGFMVSATLIAQKLYNVANGIVHRAVTDQPLFYLGLTALIIGSQLFLTGFLAELTSRNSPDRNHYQVQEIIGKS